MKKLHEKAIQLLEKIEELEQRIHSYKDNLELYQKLQQKDNISNTEKRISRYNAAITRCKHLLKSVHYAIISNTDIWEEFYKEGLHDTGILISKHSEEEIIAEKQRDNEGWMKKNFYK